MADVKDEVEELEELLVGLETEGPMEAYSEDDDAVTLSMAAPIGDQEWMVQLSPTNRKMMSTDRLVTELGLGTLNDATLVWRGGMEEWKPIAEVEDLTRARSSVPPPRPALDPAALPATAPAFARAAEPAPLEDSSSAEDDAIDDADAAAPLVPAAPAQAVPSDADDKPPPTRPRSYTGGPVAVDFSSVAPKRPASLRVFLGAGAAAAAMVLVTLFSLSRGGVFETKGSTPEGRSVSSLEPAPEATVAPAAPTAPVLAPAREPAAASPQEAAAAPAAAAPSPPPAASDAPTAEQPAAQVASSGAPQGDESKSPAATWKTRMKSKKRAQTATSEPAAATPELVASAPLEAESVPAKRAKPAARSKTQNVAAKPAVDPPSQDAEEAPAPAAGPTVGFNRQAAKGALQDAAAQAANCRPAGGPTGSGKVQVRYDATGKVGSVSILTPGFENTTTGSCIQMVFRRAKIASFSGSPVVMTESFEIK